MTKLTHVLALALTGCALMACSDDAGTQATPPDTHDMPDAGGGTEPSVPLTYTFESRFAPGESSVSYSGQIFRHVLISELVSDIDAVATAIDDPTGFAPVAGEVKSRLLFYYQFDGDTSAQLPLTLTTDPPLEQMTYMAISTGKDLQGKIAGNDVAGQHQDWSAGLVGWTVDGAPVTPDALVQAWLDELDALAVARAAGPVPTDPMGAQITKVYITPAGQDLKQLLQKFLLGSVAVSQAMDDYLDDGTEGKGILSSNAQDGSKPYSALEHAWDEAFGYFGAARDYNEYTDDELAGASGREGWSGGYHDTNGDGAIDLVSEYNFGHSTNAGKRDRGSAEAAKTDFSKAIFDAFLTGRAIIASAGDELTAEQMAALVVQRDIIVQTWEKVLVATLVHYTNEVLQDMATFDTGSYAFATHAKHWSELKGFALGLQFNPHMQLSAAQFALIHELVGMAPVLPGALAADIDAYRQALLTVRATLADVYSLDAANVGDDSGLGGW